METVIVTTKEELKKAQEQKVDEIIVNGDLANKLKKQNKLQS
jgi:metallophosphoesterase superfamily enzyme